MTRIGARMCYFKVSLLKTLITNFQRKCAITSVAHSAINAQHVTVKLHLEYQIQHAKYEASMPVFAVVAPYTWRSNTAAGYHRTFAQPNLKARVHSLTECFAVRLWNFSPVVDLFACSQSLYDHFLSVHAGIVFVSWNRSRSVWVDDLSRREIVVWCSVTYFHRRSSYDLRQRINIRTK